MPTHYETPESPAAESARIRSSPTLLGCRIRESSTATTPLTERRAARCSRTCSPRTASPSTTRPADEPHAAVPVGTAAGVLLRGDPELAAERGLENGGWATIVTARTAIEARVLVTPGCSRCGWTVDGSTRSGCRTTGDGTASASVTAPTSCCRRRWTQRVHPVHQGHQLRHPAGPSASGSRAAGVRGRVPATRRRDTRDRNGAVTVSDNLSKLVERSSAGRPRAGSGVHRPAEPQGFLHRHQRVHRVQGLRGRVQGVERRPRGRARADRDVVRQHRGARRLDLAARGLRGTAGAGRATAETVDLGMPGTSLPGADSDVTERTDFRWLMESDVCKHCTHAACLDVCPTGALFRPSSGPSCAERHLQRLWLLHPRLPVRRDRPAATAPPGTRPWAWHRSARSVTTGSRAGWNRRARRRVPRIRSSSAIWTSCASAPIAARATAGRG